IHLLLGRCAQATGHDAVMFSHAAAAVEIAAREGYFRSVLDEGPEVLELLRNWGNGDAPGTHRQYISRLISNANPGRENGSASNASLVESLTPRQMDVLRLMVEGLSNRDIADRLYVSEGTVK